MKGNSGQRSRLDESVVALRVRNSRTNEMQFYLKPWGERYTLAPGSVFEVIARGPAGNFIELEYGD